MPKRIRERVTSNVHAYDDLGLGIDFETAFGREYSVKDWETIFGDYKINRNLKLKLLEEEVGEALNRSQEERTKYIETLVLPVEGVVVSKNAKKLHEQNKRIKRIRIGINSMSETNLNNLKTAVFNLLQKN